MAKLKRDERVCPYCAETIKAAATKCRYCQSDVTPVVEPEPAPKPETPPEPEAPPEPMVEESVDAPKRSVPSFDDVRLFVQTRLTLVLAVLVLLAAAGVGVAWYRAEQGSSAVAPGGSLVGSDARTQVLVAAADLTQRTLSYDYKTLANDMEVARARMTPSFRKEYADTMAQVKGNTEKNKIVLEAVAVSSAIIEATEHKATVLVFVNQTTTAGTGKNRNQQLNRNSLVITLSRGEGEWNMSKLTALG
jgi:Mce-associated membrane protein